MDSSELRVELEKHHRESYGWALGCCARNREEAENVLQAVYLKALEGKARFDGRAAFKTWLFAVIRKTAADERRKRVLRWFYLTERESNAVSSIRAECLDETIYRSEIQLALRRALTRLPKRQREVLQLVFYHDLSLADAAEVMGVSLGSARTHYERGKKRLRKLIEVTGVFDESGTGRKSNPGIVQTIETR